MLQLWVLATTFRIFVGALPLTQGTLVAVKCAAASGSINCDWKCFDNCVYDKPELLGGAEFKRCIAALEEACLIPATTYLVTNLPNYCYQEEPEVEGNSYNVAVPALKDDLWLKLHSQKPKEVLLNVGSEEFNSTTCLASLVKFGLAASNGLSDPCAKLKTDADFSQINAPFTFGFTQLAVNVTDWAIERLDALAGIGEHDQLLHLLTGTACAGKPTSMTLSYTSDIVIDSADYNHAMHSTLAVVPFLTFIVLFSVNV